MHLTSTSFRSIEYRERDIRLEKISLDFTHDMPDCIDAIVVIAIQIAPAHTHTHLSLLCAFEHVIVPQ